MSSDLLHTIIARYERTVTNAKSVPLHFKWFDITGIMPEMPDDKMFRAVQDAVEFGHLPFSHCALFGKDLDGQEFVLFATERKDEQLRFGITGVVFENNSDRNYIVPPLFFDIENGKMVTNEQPKDMQITSITLSMLGVFMNSLDAGPLTAHEPRVEQTFTNRRKLAQNKPVKYTWSTITIQPTPRAYSEHKGGTHASPRLHDRRGHWRITHKGKKVWVKHCTVGKASLGTAFHDYKVINQ